MASGIPVVRGRLPMPKKFRYGSVCSGIEAASVAWEPLGWQPSFLSEIEPFPSAVLAHHYPEVPNLGDFTTIGEEWNGSVDLICGGTPCQSFSVAGARAGMDDPRGNLAIEFIRLVSRTRPRWVVWENVPGVLSSWSDAAEEGYETNDFDTFLSLLGECGYGFAWSILDAQYFGVPQRRRRVFVVGHLGDWRPAAAVLFEREGLQRHSQPRREAGESVAATLKGGSGERGFNSDNESGLTLDKIRDGVRNHAITSHPDRQDPNGNTFVIKGASIGRKPEAGPQYGEVLDDGTCYTLNCTENHAIAFAENSRNEIRVDETDTAFALSSVGGGRPGLSYPAVFYQKPKPETVYGFSAGQSSGSGTIGYQPEQAPTLKGAASGSNQVPTILYQNPKVETIVVKIDNTKSNGWGVLEDGTAHTLGGSTDAVLSITERTRNGERQLEFQADKAYALTNPGDGGRSQDRLILAPTLSTKNEPASSSSTRQEWYETSAELLQVVRRLTPVECERLQGFPDNWTNIQFKGKPAADSHRYKALGNSMAVPVMRWIGNRIKMVERLLQGCPDA